MALKISTTSRKPGLVWRGAVSDLPWGWGPLVRSLQGHYQISIDSLQEAASVPTDLQGFLGKRSVEAHVTIDLLGPGAGPVPEHGHWLHLPPWKFTSLPESWLVPALNGSDRLLVASEAQYQGFMADAIPAERMSILPLGVDLVAMTPAGSATYPTGVKGRRIAFIGDLTWQSGIEVLLAAYGAEFLAADDVSLLLIDIDQAAEAQRAAALAQLQALQTTPDAPHVLHLPMPHDPRERAALLRSADVLVYLARDAAHPWPVIEAMACGVPVAVANQGTAAGVVPPEAGWRLEATMTAHADTRLGAFQTLSPATFYDVSADALRRLLRQVIENPEVATAKRAAARAAAEPFGWERIRERFNATLADVTAQPLRRQRTWELQAAFVEANQAFVKEDYAEARRLLEPFDDLTLGSPEFYTTYGSSLLFTGSPSKAIPVLARAITLQRSNANYYNLVGIALFQLKEYPLARRFVKAALAIQPDHPGAMDSLVAADRELAGKSAKYREKISKPFQHLLPLVEPWEQATQKPVRLSVSMIVKNEEKFLAQCLASIQDIADEIVVVDTGSTDRTVEIAESFGAKVGHFEWTGDFSEARNASLDLCTGDWVLALDADEVLAPECGAILRALLTQSAGQMAIYLPRIINRFNDDDIDGIEHFAPRLFPRQQDLRWTGRIHEQVTSRYQNKDIKRLRVPTIVLHHYGYNPDIVAERDKDARNFALLEQSLHEEPNNSFHHFNMGVALRVSGKTNEAIPYFRKAIDLGHAAETLPMYITTAYNYLIASLNTVGRTQEALDVARSCEIYCQDQADYWLSLGSIHQNLGEHQEAIKAFQRCLTLRHSSTSLIADRGAMTWKPYAGIGSAYLKLGNAEKGERYLRMALKENPKNLEIRRLLLRQALSRQELDRIEADLRAMIEETKGTERRTVYQDLANFFLQLRRYDEAVAALTEAKSRAAGELEMAGAISDLARVLQIVGRNDDALALMEAHQLSAGVFEELGKIYGREQDWDALVRLCDSLLANEIGKAYAHAQRAIALLHKGDMVAAETDLRAALEIDPTDADSWNNLGVIALGREAIEEAEGYYKQALAHKPETFSANLDLGKIALYRQQPEEAYPYLQAALKAIPNDPTALALAADAATALDDQHAAEGHLHDLIDAEPTESGHWVQLGYHYLNRGEATAAMRVLGEALEMTKSAPNPAVYSALGVTLLELGKMEDARNAFILAVHLSPDDPQAMQGLQLADRLCQVS